MDAGSLRTAMTGVDVAYYLLHSLQEGEGLEPAVVEGDSFHRYDRAEMKLQLAENEKTVGGHLSHFGPEANLFGEIETLFKTYSETGTGRRRYYLHNAEEAETFGQEPGTFTPWAELPDESDLLFYEDAPVGLT